MDDPETMRWVWLIATAVLLGGELLTAGALIMLPIALGTGVATVIAFAGGDVVWQWSSFLAVAIISSFAFIPLRRRLDGIPQPTGVGANRLVQQEGIVLEAIEEGPTGRGLVKIGREEWRAMTRSGNPVEAGRRVIVIDVEGTGVIVEAVEP
ncbi:MAG: NfeD family protein [Actinobacteria bacterium]|nr:NfeD family protein [Actinomycetota bacterium]